LLSELPLELIELALREDLGAGDITSLATIPAERLGRARIIAREELAVCGQQVAQEVFSRVDSALQYRAVVPDGTILQDGQELAQIEGPLRGILSAERTALNFLQRLSGVATYTRNLMSLLVGTNTKLLDTRKTTPGYRMLEKYAVQIGGGANHRLGLFDAFLIKNNHLDSLNGEVALAVSRCQQFAPGKPVELEVRNRAEFEQGLVSGADILLLDNMTPAEVAELVSLRNELRNTGALAREVRLEASGGISALNLRAYGESGVDYVSLGSLTHSARAVDISLRYVA